MLKMISKTMHEIQFKYSSINEVDTRKNFSRTISLRKKVLSVKRVGWQVCHTLLFLWECP